MACDSPIQLARAGEKYGGKTQILDLIVPCGKCPPCAKRRIDEWVFRLTQEEWKHSSAHFITLTYSQENVPISPNGYMTLTKGNGRKINGKKRQESCFQLFMKRLRKNLQNAKRHQTIKYYMASEYGTITQRPHYHAIMFGNDLTIDDYDKAWRLGSVHAGKVSGDSISYTCKYLDKPSTLTKNPRDDRVKEYSVSSKGMGLNYITPEIIKWHTDDLKRNYIIKEGGHKIALPRIYREVIYTSQQLLDQRDVIQTAIQEAETKFTQQHGSEATTVKESGKIFRYNKLHKQKQKIRDGF